MSKVGEIQATLFRQAEEEKERNRKDGDAQDDEVDGEVKSRKAGNLNLDCFHAPYVTTKNR